MSEIETPLLSTLAASVRNFTPRWRHRKRAHPSRPWIVFRTDGKEQIVCFSHAKQRHCLAYVRQINTEEFIREALTALHKNLTPITGSGHDLSIIRSNLEAILEAPICPDADTFLTHLYTDPLEKGENS